MIEENPVRGEEPVSFAVIDRLPMRVTLRARVGAAWMERGGFALRNVRDPPEHLGRSSLIVAHLPSVAIVVITNRLEEAQCAESDHISSVFRLIERDPDVRLRRQIVNFVGEGLFDDPPQSGRVAKVAVM